MHHCLRWQKLLTRFHKSTHLRRRHGAYYPRQATERLTSAKKDLKDLNVLQQHASNVSRLLQDTERLQQDISDIQKELSASGSTKTATDVQHEIDSVLADL